MIMKPTVFILGAGASKPYGFPTGRELKKEILFNLNMETEPNWDKELHILNVSNSEILEFFHRLFESDIDSVDEFLEFNPKFITIGKLTIALALIPREHKINLLNADNSWYRYLFNRMKTPFDDFNKNKVSFLTYNYDRSLEFYLQNTLKNRYGKSDIECAEKLCEIPVIHMHGKLGSLPWEDGIKRQYGSGYALSSPRSAGALRKISEGIRIVFEDITQYEEFRQSYEILTKAEFIYFLGFGYSDINLSRLGVSNIKNRTFKGTAYGLKQAETIYINQKWKIQLWNHSNIDFLREEVSWINIQS